MIERFRSSQGDISPPAGGEFLSQRWERNQRIAGGRGRRALRAHRTAYPRSPITGVTPLAWRWIFGAQNLSGLLPFNPGHWALGVQKFRTNAVPQPRLALPSQRARSVFRRRGGLWPPAGAHSAPLRKNESASEYAIGAGPRPACRCLEPNLSPASHKGALSTDRRNTQRLPDPQRQRS